MRRNQKGFTLIELLIVVAIIGILAAIAIPNLLTAMQRSKQKRTMTDLRTIATTIETYTSDKNTYPSMSSIEELKPLLVPTYIRMLPTRDEWNDQLQYEYAETKD